MTRWRYKPTREDVRLKQLAQTYHEGGANEGRCMCFLCGAADGCEAPSEFTAVGDEVSLELCQRCYEDHRSLALEVVEAATW